MWGEPGATDAGGVADSVSAAGEVRSLMELFAFVRGRVCAVPGRARVEVFHRTASGHTHGKAGSEQWPMSLNAHI
ncbi:hypothetical protein GCM10010272_19210 [Streptomyces lateritius]|nr:hypothetical protein GCM10010272_19210 [Streptomyces lateritius]